MIIIGKKNKGAIILGFLILLAFYVASYFGVYKQSIFSPATGVSFVSFLGSGGTTLFNDAWIQDTESPATLGKYKVTMAKDNLKAPSVANQNTQWGCSFSASVSYDGVVIDTIPQYTASTTSRGYLKGKITSLNSQTMDDDFSVKFNAANSYNYDSHICRWIKNEYYIRPKNNVTVSVATPSTNYFEGQDVTVEIVINNDGTTDLSGVLTVQYQIPTGLINPSTQLETKNIIVPVGVSKHTYTIPTSESTKKILITPKIDLNVPIVGYTNVLYWNGAYYPISTIKEMPFGSVTEKTFEVMIVPKPLYLSPPCIGGYTLNTKGDYCVRDDIKSLSCYQLGCPNVEGHDYSCTSAGICAETVYTTVWGDCPSGTTSTTTDKGEKICIKTEIASVFLECSDNSEKPNVCSGITATCVNNKWDFQGKCDVITEVQTQEIVKEIIVEKTIWGLCPSDTVTETATDGSNFCVKTITNTQTVEVVNVVEKPVDRIINTTTSYIPTWVYVVGGIGIVTILALMLKKKRR